MYLIRLFQSIIDRIFGGVTFEEYLKSLDYIDYNTKYLFLDNNKLIDLKGIEKFKNLIHLNCTNNLLRNLNDIYLLEHLEELICYNNRLTDIKVVKNLKKLQRIECENNRLKDLEGIEDLKDLKFLVCFNNRIKYNLVKNIPKGYTYLLTYSFKNWEALNIEYVNNMITETKSYLRKQKIKDIK